MNNQLPLWHICTRCGDSSLMDDSWAIDRDLRDFIDVHGDYEPPCGHPIDPHNVRVGVSWQLAQR